MPAPSNELDRGPDRAKVNLPNYLGVDRVPIYLGPQRLLRLRELYQVDPEHAIREFGGVVN